MPLYEFKCRDCDHNWEVKLAYRDPYPDCPACGSGEVRKVFHPAALIFKGSGWHQNDYGKHGAKPAAASNGANGESKPAETKPAATEKPAETAAKSSDT